MSKIRTMLQVFVASGNKSIFRDVDKLITTGNVVNIELDASGKLCDADKKQIEENADILLADVPVIIGVAHTAKKLKWAASTWAGVEPLIKYVEAEKNTPPAFPVTRMGAYGNVMGEYVLGHIIMKERLFLQLSHEQQNTNWNKATYSKYRCLKDLTIGILGVGEIGKCVSEMCHNMGMKVIGVTRTVPHNKTQAISDYRTISELPTVLADCDYVVNILPSTPQTRGLLSGEVFSHCKQKKTVFINIGRGDVTDEESIVKAIREGWLGGAVLDVFKVEPLPPTSPLWSLPGVIITPHVAGTTLSHLVAESFLENYNLFIEEKPLKFVLNFDRGY